MSTASSASVLHPSILPFSIVSYDGSKPPADDDFPIQNALDPSPDRFHCSRDGRNFNLLLQYTPSLTDLSASATVTHIVIHGPLECTAPIRTGVVFAHLAPPSLGSYTSRYDDLTRAEYEELPPSTLRGDGAVAYFTCTDIDHLQTPITLPAWTPLRYLHLKLISAIGQQDDNIDLARIAVVGYPHTEVPAVEVPLGAGVLSALGLVVEPLGAWNRVSQDHMRVLTERAVCVLWGRDPMSVDVTRARTVLHQIASSGAYEDQLVFFYHDDSNIEQQFAAQVAFTTGVHIPRPAGALHEGQDREDGRGEEDGEGERDDDSLVGLAPCTSFRLVIADMDSGQRFHYEGEVDEAAVRSWLDAFVSSALTPWLRSDSLPPVDPDHPGHTRVTARTFDELVLRSDRDVLLLAFTPDNAQADEDGPTDTFTQRSLYAVAAALQGVEQVTVASFNALRNYIPAELDASLLQARSSVLWLYPRDGKKSPVLFSEEPLPSALLSFVHSRMAEPKFDLAAASAQCANVEREVKRAADVTALLGRVSRVFGEVKAWLSKEETAELKVTLPALMMALERGNDEAEVNSKSRRVQGWLSEWQPSFDALVEARRALQEIDTKRTADTADVLTADEHKQLSDAAVAVVQRLPPSSSSDEASATHLPHDVAGLQAATQRLVSLYDTLRPRLEARIAEVETRINGRVLKVHSASEFAGQLTAATAEHRLVVVDFTAVWCGPCKAVTPVYGALSEEWPAVLFLKVDVDEVEDVVMQYGVEAMPTFVFIRDGQEVERTRIKGANVAALKRSIQLLATPTEQAKAA